MLEEYMKDLIKNEQSITITHAIGVSMVQKNSQISSNSDTKCTDILSYTKSDFNNVIDKIGNSIKGQFGDQVIEAFNNQKNVLENL